MKAASRLPFNSEWGATVLRVVVGLVFAMHGGQKLFVYGFDAVAGSMGDMGIPLPYLSGVMATVAEFGGGVALILGAFTRLAAIPLAFTMVVATLTVHRSAFFLPAGMEYTLTLLSASVALFFFGSGPLSVDAWRARRAGEAG